jgi:hypothetical protein
MLLNIVDACTIADIIRAAQGNQPVVKLLDDGNLLSGTARAICSNDRGSFLARGEDVRDGFLWVTTHGGMESFWPMREVIPGVQAGTYALNYDPR